MSNSSMNAEGVHTVITVMNMKALDNTLVKGQKNGDATKVIASGEIEEMKISMPKIETSVGTHKVEKGDKASLRRRALQLAITRAQSARTADDNVR